MKKKLFGIFSSLLTLILLTVSASASDKSGWYTSIDVDGVYISYIRNEYYEKYHDDLFERSYVSYLSEIAMMEENSPAYQQLFKESYEEFFGASTMQKIGAALHEEMLTSDDVYYLSIYLNEEEDFSEEHNRAILAEINGIDEILYCGSTTPCAVVAVTGKNIDALLASDRVEFVNYAFSIFNYHPAGGIPEDGNIQYSPNPVLARKLLRYSAGLFGADELATCDEVKQFFYLGDADCDGKITAADARTALRISAKLEEGKTYTVRTMSFWSF